jgi:hypothetical protein
MAAVYGIALRISFVPDRWELLRGFQTTDAAWAHGLAVWIGRAVARPVPLRVAVVDPFCPVHGS